MTREASDDLRQAAELESLGDGAAVAGSPAVSLYREAQRLLLPAGVVWADREAYDSRIAAFERIQQKLYGLDGAGNPRDWTSAPAAVPEARPPSAPPADDRPADGPPPSTATAAELSVWHFFPGLTVQVVQDFTDYDGQQIRAGEVLHFIESSYFFYEGGHTLRFAGKTIRLADIVDEHQPIIANAGNAWFQPIVSADLFQPL